MRRKLLASGFSVAGLRMLGALLGLVVTIMLSRYLGPSGLGTYAYTVTCLRLATVPVSYGWATLLLKTVSQSQYDEKWDQAKGLAIRGAHLALLAAVLLLSAFLVGSTVSPGFLPDALTPFALAMLAAVLVFDQLSAIRTAMLRGLDHPVIGQIPEMVVRPAILILGALVVFRLAGDSASVFHALVALTAAAGASALIGQVLLWQKAPNGLLRAGARFSTWAWLAVATPMAASSGLMVLNGYVDLLVLGAVGSATDVGLYRVAMQVSLASSMVYTALNMLANQRFAYFRASGDFANAQGAATLMARAALACAIPLPVILVIGGGQMVAAVFGDEFQPALAPMVILTVGQCLNAATGMARTLLIMSGQEKAIVSMTLIAVLGNLMCCAALIPSFGIVGAALANLVVTGGLNLALWAYARRVAGIDTSFTGLFSRPLKADGSW